jgi:hypothetical protein
MIRRWGGGGGLGIILSAGCRPIHVYGSVCRLYPWTLPCSNGSVWLWYFYGHHSSFCDIFFSYMHQNAFAWNVLKGRKCHAAIFALIVIHQLWDECDTLTHDASGCRKHLRPAQVLTGYSRNLFTSFWVKTFVGRVDRNNTILNNPFLEWALPTK